MCVADWSIAKRLNLSRQDLLHPALTVSVADNSNLELIGAHFLTLSSDHGETNQLVYFATDVGDFYLSKTAMVDLNIISSDFPQVGAANTQRGNVNEVQDGSPSELLHLQQQVHPVRQRHVAPPPQPSCSSPTSSPGVPPGTTSQGSRSPPVIEGWQRSGLRSSIALPTGPLIFHPWLPSQMVTG